MINKVIKILDEAITEQSKCRGNCQVEMLFLFINLEA